MCLLLGAPGVGKTLLMKRLQNLPVLTLRIFNHLLPKLSSKDSEDMMDVPPTQPTVGTNLTDLAVHRTRVTVREVGGSMGPIWHSYYRDCKRVMFVVDASNPVQVSASCIQLLSVLSSDLLASASALVMFNKMDLPSCMPLVELKSLFRMDDIISCAKQPITVLEISARDGTGLQDILRWLQSSRDPKT